MLAGVTGLDEVHALNFAREFVERRNVEIPLQQRWPDTMNLIGLVNAPIPDRSPPLRRCR